MGEVYRARDTKLHRDVALKVLPDFLANDPERLARFHREAQVLASLNHPNIAIIHGLEEADGVKALVLELVEGPTLEELIVGSASGVGLQALGQRRALPIEDALPIARQIADALDAAHAHGIVHRDLKPANIKVRDDGTVKVLDFGLAKALQSDAAAPAASNSPTLSVAATRAGVILGTAAYMAPEQARGNVVDKRADIWAFGCVLYEMLAGRRAFEGDEVSETLAAVLRGEPDWDVLPADVPAAIRVLLKRCLQKDRSRRVGDISTALLLIEEAASFSGGQATAAARSAGPPRLSLWRRVATPVAAWLTGGDGQRFLMLKQAGTDQTAAPPQLIVVQHWVEELKRLVPPN
jgi:serine/threonine protein kinase